MVTKIPVCDYCIEAVEDDALGLDFTEDEVEQIASTMGELLADHLCSSIEDNIKCSCLCKK